MFTGSAVALVTPFRDDKVDYAALGALMDWHAEQGSDAIVVCGTTGESATLTHTEHEEIISFAAKHHPGPRGKAGRPYLIAGTGSNSTAEAVRLTQHAEQAGVDAALLITPYYNKPTQTGLLRHFEAIATATKVALIPYCVPSRTALNIPVESAVALSKMDGVVGIKEASGNLEQISEIIRRCGEGFHVWSGDDAMTLPIVALGGKGVISVTANVAPRKMHDLAATSLAGDLPAARALHHELFPLTKTLFLETNPIPVKTAVQMMHDAGVPGIPAVGLLRPPLCEPAAATLEALSVALKEAGIIT